MKTLKGLKYTQYLSSKQLNYPRTFKWSKYHRKPWSWQKYPKEYIIKIIKTAKWPNIIIKLRDGIKICIWNLLPSIWPFYWIIWLNMYFYQKKKKFDSICIILFLTLWSVRSYFGFYEGMGVLLMSVII